MAVVCYSCAKFWQFYCDFVATVPTKQGSLKHDGKRRMDILSRVHSCFLFFSASDLFDIVAHVICTSLYMGIHLTLHQHNASSILRLFLH